MSDQSPPLRRRAFSIWHPDSWWDHFFIRTFQRAERLWADATFKKVSALPVALFRLLIWGVSPVAEIGFQHRPSWRRIIAVAVGAAVAAFLFSFGLNYVFAYAAGTLSGSETGRLYYLNDKYNLGIYIAIAPIYIACSAVIIYVYLSSSLFMRRFDEPLSPDELLRLTLKLIAFAVLLLGADALVQYRYYMEVVFNYDSLPHMTDEKFRRRCAGLLYWFVERAESGNRTLNVSGMFYFIGNFVRLGVVIAAAFCFIGASATLVRLGLQIAPGQGQSFEIQSVREMLYSFSIIELWTKGLYFILNVHSKVWGGSCISGSLNYKLAGVAVFVLGWMALTIPRNFVEYRLWLFLRAQAEASPRDGLPDLRNQETRWMYTAASSLFFLTVATLLLISNDGPIGPKVLWGLLSALGLSWLPPLFGIQM
jgi:hypothetical protein